MRRAALRSIDSPGEPGRRGLTLPNNTRSRTLSYYGIQLLLSEIIDGVVSLSFTSRVNMHGACICILAVFVAWMHEKSVKSFTKDGLESEDTAKRVAYYSRHAPFVTATARMLVLFFSAHRAHITLPRETVGRFI